MGKKKGGTRSRKKIVRVDPNAKRSPETKESKTASPEPTKPNLPERIQEKDAGFGVIKIIAGIIVALVIGSAVLFNRAGGRQRVRGDKLQGELCEETVECSSGSLCYSYKGEDERCMKLCSKENPCDPDQSCVTAAQQKRRKGFRLTDICVENAKF